MSCSIVSPGKSHYFYLAHLFKTPTKNIEEMPIQPQPFKRLLSTPLVGARQDALQRMTLSGMPNEAQWTSALEVPTCWILSILMVKWSKWIEVEHVFFCTPKTSKRLRYTYIYIYINMTKTKENSGTPKIPR